MSNISNIKKLLWAGLCILALACTKNSTSPKPESGPETPVSTTTQLYPVKFRIADIDPSNGRKAAKEMPAKDYLHYIFYGAYDANGRLASKIVQDYTGPVLPGAELGILQDSLPAGDYTILISGGTGQLQFLNTDSTLTSLTMYNGGDDIFHRKFSVTVGPHDTATSVVRLSRITGQLEVQLTDSLPNTVDNIMVEFNSFPVSFYPLTEAINMGNASGAGWGVSDHSVPIPTTGHVNMYGSNFQYIVRIVAYAGTVALYQKEIKNVYVYPNKKTVLKGAITALPNSLDGTGSINVVIDPDYADTIIQTF